MNKVCLAIVVVVVLATCGALTACERQATPQSRTIFFAGEAVANVDETVQGRHVTRVVRLGDERITTEVDLDALGFVVAATYDRPKKRHLTLRGDRIVDDGGRFLRLPDGPLTLVELVPRLRVTTPTRAVLLDLSSAEFLPVTISRKGPEIVVVDDGGATVIRAVPEGQRSGPGVFVEGDAAGAVSSPVDVVVPGLRNLLGKRLAGEAGKVPLPSTFAPAPSASSPALFLESDDPAVRAFAACSGSALDDARRIAEATHAKVDAAKSAEPPSALHMLHHGGDCDGAAALVAASLRACGHPARAVVGYTLKDAGSGNARLVPHALVEVYAGTSWTKVDATVPSLGDPDSLFLTVAEGLGGALTMGRVLGRVDAGDVVGAVVDGSR